MESTSQPTRKSKVTLREITGETVREICNLKVTPAQNQFVAPVSVSIAQAYFEPNAWFRAIVADETPVGFLMVYRDEAAHDYFLWRFLIDSQYQRMGFGQQAMILLIEEVRTWPDADALLVSYVPEKDGPKLFYQNLGFVPTGEMEGVEEVAALILS